MSVFDIYRSEENKSGTKGKTTRWGPREIEVVKRGFSWPGFFVVTLWAFAKRLYLQGVVLGIIWITLLVAQDAASTTQRAGDEWLAFAEMLAAALAIGLKGNAWRRSELTSHGFALVETIEAPSAALALGRYRTAAPEKARATRD